MYMAVFVGLDANGYHESAVAVNKSTFRCDMCSDTPEAALLEVWMTVLWDIFEMFWYI